MKKKYIAPVIEEISGYEDDLMEGLSMGSIEKPNPDVGEAKGSFIIFDPFDETGFDTSPLETTIFDQEFEYEL